MNFLDLRDLQKKFHDKKRVNNKIFENSTHFELCFLILSEKKRNEKN